MGDVIDFDSRHRSGDQTFVICGHCSDTGEEDVAMLPVAMMGQVPFIAFLVCPKCDAEVPVVNGCLTTASPDPTDQ